LWKGAAVFPIGTVNNPTRNRPYLTYGLILINIVVFIWELTIPQQDLMRTFYQLASVPCELVKNPLAINNILSIFRSMFFHADIVHLTGNMTFLWIFGTNVEDYLGKKAFLAFYLLGGIVADLVQAYTFPACIPGVGASGAISGILGAYILLYPGTKIRNLIILIRFPIGTVDVPAILMIGYWFIIQLLNGISILGTGTISGGGVAFWAHIGGFVAGAIMIFLTMMFKGQPKVEA
jgi:membrane associated rhomboid family serine protease